MEPNTYKTDFSYFVRMALKNDMPWKTLAMILMDLTPTMDKAKVFDWKEVREVLGGAVLF